MKEFIFITTEGFTYDLNNKLVNNMQILGSSEGVDILEAFMSFKQTHSYLKEYSFKNIIAQECVGGFIRNLEL